MNVFRIKGLDRVDLRAVSVTSHTRGVVLLRALERELAADRWAELWLEVSKDGSDWEPATEDDVRYHFKDLSTEQRIRVIDFFLRKRLPFQKKD